MERVPAPHQDTDYLVRFAVPESTSICPVTGQPDSLTWLSTMCRKTGSSSPSR